MKLRAARRSRSGIQGSLTRSAPWMPVRACLDSGIIEFRKVRVDLLPEPKPQDYRGQTTLVVSGVDLRTFSFASAALPATPAA